MIVTSLVFLGNHTKNYFDCHGYIPGHEYIPTEMDFLQHKKFTIYIQNELKKFPLSIFNFYLSFEYLVCV